MGMIMRKIQIMISDQIELDAGKIGESQAVECAEQGKTLNFVQIGR
jgi:hypothetical protein